MLLEVYECRSSVRRDTGQQGLQIHKVPGSPENLKAPQNRFVKRTGIRLNVNMPS